MSQVSGQQLDHLAHVETGTGGVHLTGGSAMRAAIGLQSFLRRGFSDAIEGGSSALARSAPDLPIGTRYDDRDRALCAV